jgi:hypothetical protein
MRFRPTRLRALAALAVFIASLGVRAADTRHAFGADPDVDGGVMVARQGLAQVAAEPELIEGSDEHCVICHWGRTFAGSMAGDSIRVAAPVAALTDRVAWVSDAASSERLTAAPRGPPAFSL